MLTLKVFAKLNVFLDVFEKQRGFHNLESAMLSVGVFDTVTIKQRSDKKVTVNDFLGIPCEQNIAFEAARRFVDGFSLNGCDIHIEKGIPEASGMGGSSADAAAVIFGLMKLHGIAFSKEIKQLLTALGSDVLFMFFGGLAFVSGRGEVAEFVEFSRQYHFAITTFDTKMSTAKVFARFDEIPRLSKAKFDAKSVVEAVASGNLSSEMLFNSLSCAAKSISGYATDYLDFCSKHNLLPSLTGSGSAYFLLCQSFEQASEMAEFLTANGFSTIATSSKNHGIEVV